jgi:hypothetical protein
MKAPVGSLTIPLTLPEVLWLNAAPAANAKTPPIASNIARREIENRMGNNSCLFETQTPCSWKAARGLLSR